ncbi:lytic transglycosylase domain-containing protein [Candidatus Poribacteria bacterium]|nr:lytic transglycosylase domain-containing protein [Candidatus Poribacteria bacterium]
MKTQLATLIFRELRWFFIPIFFILFTAFLFEKFALSDSNSPQSEIVTDDLRPAVGTRGLGLSHAFISNADDATSPIWNPAGLAVLKHGNVIYDFSQGALSVAYPINTIGTFGFNLLDFNISDRFLVHHTFNPFGTFEYGYNQALISYARKIGSLKLGVSTGYSRAPYTNSLWAPNYDFGAVMSFSPHVTVGMQFRDISGVSIQDPNGKVLQSFNQQFAVGTTLTPHPLIRWHSCINITSPSLGTSFEIVTGPLSANVGSHFSLDSNAPVQSWSLGLSFKKWGKQTYYTFLNEDNLSYKHLLAFGLTFGEPKQTSNENKTEIDKPISTKSTSSETRKPPDKLVPKSNVKKSVQIAKKHNVSVELMLAMIYVESKFNPVAVSRTGAGGLMQMVPGTARELGLKVPKYANKLKPNLDGKVDERFDAKKNLIAGLIYFNRLRKKYHNDLTLALGAYNVGPGRVRVRGPLISRGRKYVQTVINRQNQYRRDAALLETDLNRLEIVLNNK